jgi:hypothetical protein
MDVLINQMGDEIYNYVIEFTDGREAGTWNNTPHENKIEILQVWCEPTVFTLNRQIGNNNYTFTLDQLSAVNNVHVVGRQNGGIAPLLQAHTEVRARFDRAYTYLVENPEMVWNGEDWIDGVINEMNIGGGGKRRKKRSKSKRRKSKRRKSKRHKSKTRRRRRR